MKPIIMMPESIKAIQKNRKTLTIRVVSPQPKFGHYEWRWQSKRGYYPSDLIKQIIDACSYGQIDDAMWTKEKFRMGCRMGQGNRHGTIYEKYMIIYADETFKWFDNTNSKLQVGETFKSPFYQPKWASRLHLKIIDIKAKKLQDITDEEIVANGVLEDCNLTEAFQQRWDAINNIGKRKYGWKTNPIVRLISFEKIFELDTKDM